MEHKKIVAKDEKLKKFINLYFVRPIIKKYA